jgi:putative DNA primase/helicase
MTPLDAARQYAASGLSVFACHYPVLNGTARCSCGDPECSSPAKHPYGRLACHGCRSASREPRVVTSWFGSGVPYNIAIATGTISGVIVLDVDPRHGGDDTLKCLEAEHGPLPPTWRVLSGGGGEHYYFRHPGLLVGNSVGSLGPGLDLKADGGYVIAPPSRHICGRPYTWNVDFHPEDTPLAAMPDWLVANTKASAAHNGNINWQAFADAIVPEGGRHNAIIRLCGLLFYRLRAEAHLAATLVYSFNQTHCTPPLDDLEVRRMIEWAAKQELERQSGGAR